MVLFFWRVVSVLISLSVGVLSFFVSRIAAKASTTISLAIAIAVAIPLLVLILRVIDSKRNKQEWAYVHGQLKEAKRKLRRIAQYRFHVKMWKRRQTILHLYRISRHIVSIVEKEPARFQKANTFFSLYVDSIYTVLKKYQFLLSQPVHNQETKLTLRKTEKMLSDLVPALEQELSHILADDVLDLKVELDVLEKNMLPIRTRAELKVKEKA